MSQVTYRANLSARVFPFISENWGRTVIVPQYDNTFSRQLTSQDDVDRDVGIPQVYYCHNVMPHQQGLQSVGYKTVWADSDSGEEFVDILDFGPGSAVYIGQTASGNLYAQEGFGWILLGAHVPGVKLSSATLNGVSYIYIGNEGCYTYDFITKTLISVPLTGLDPTIIIGIVAAVGYMIAYSIDAIAWSSNLDVTDFTPSLITGAGGGNVQEAKGTFVTCTAHTLGFIIYTRGNIVVSIFSNNARYPFNFRELVGTGGISGTRHISFDANTGNQYAYTTSGLQLISSSQANTVFPEFTDFVAGQLMEDYDEVTKEFLVTNVERLIVQVTLISDRYLVLSYGEFNLTHALVHDLISKRWGKLKIPHICCFEYFIPSDITTETPRKSIAFLQHNGKVVVVDFSVVASSGSGVLCCGKYQFVRQRNLQLNEVMMENVPVGAPFTLSTLVALDGKNTIREEGILNYTKGLFRQYGFRAEGVNHSLIMEGVFTTVSLVINFCLGAKR